VILTGINIADQSNPEYLFKMSQFPPSGKYLIRLLLAVTIVYVCIVLQNLLVPLLFSVLFAYLLYPGAVKLESIGIPRMLTNIILIVTAIVLILISIYAGGQLIASFTEDLAEIQEQFQENMTYFQERIESIFGFSIDPSQNGVNDLDGVAEYIVNFFTATTNTIVAFGLMPVYTFLLLFYRNKFRTFLHQITPKDTSETVDQIVSKIATIVPKYLKGLIVVVLVLVVINSTAFWLIGLEYPIILGVIAALFNFIPYLGTVIGFAAALMIVLATQEPTMAIWVILLFFPIQFFENNILTPNITGSYVHINPLIIILSLLSAAMMWGLPGMLLVIPFLAMLKIVCEHIDSLKPIGYLISTRGTEDHVPTMAGLKNRVMSLFE